MSCTPTDTNQLLHRIQSLDLGPIKYKLVHNDEGQPWSREKVERVETLYRAFLFLTQKYPAEAIVPTKDIDAFWHAHILDTPKYAEDCAATFGSFLHHFPYFGLRGPDDEAALARAFERTKALFKSECGIDVQCATDSTSDCKSGDCGTACGNKCSDEGVSGDRPTLT